MICDQFFKHRSGFYSDHIPGVRPRPIGDAGVGYDNRRFRLHSGDFATLRLSANVTNEHLFATTDRDFIQRHCFFLSYTADRRFSVTIFSRDSGYSSPTLTPRTHLINKALQKNVAVCIRGFIGISSVVNTFPYPNVFDQPCKSILTSSSTFFPFRLQTTTIKRYESASTRRRDVLQ